MKNIILIIITFSIFLCGQALATSSMYEENNMYEEFEYQDVQPNQQYIEIQEHVLDDQEFYVEPEEEYQETDNEEYTEDID